MEKVIIESDTLKLLKNIRKSKTETYNSIIKRLAKTDLY